MCIASNFQDAFLSTLSLRRATCRLLDTRIHTTISIHALLAESDKRPGCQQQGKKYFYPRSPCGERLLNPFKTLIILIFLSTLSLRRATWADTDYNLSDIISIHALLAESDVSFMLYDTSSLIFLSTLSLRRATEKVPADVFYQAFLSTLSLRRATQQESCNGKAHVNFYPRSPCGERRHQGVSLQRAANISIHALLAESDRLAISAHCFDSRISIHALLAESDF